MVKNFQATEELTDAEQKYVYWVSEQFYSHENVSFGVIDKEDHRRFTVALNHVA